jgi:peptidyl-prolyl cis-trans isomerase B (cyclophilin B)
VASSKNQERDAREARDRLKAYNARQAVHTQQITRRRRDNLIAALAVVVIAAAATGVQIFYFTAGPGAPEPIPSASGSNPAAAEGANVGAVPDVSVAENRTWTGTMTINGIPLGFELDGVNAPQATAVFVSDTQSGYYTDKTCHRMVQSATAGLLQCGSETGDGSSDGTFSYGPYENVPADTNYLTGYLAIARTGTAYGNGHQFFIVYSDTVLPGDTYGGYTVVGKITSGLDQLVTGVVSGGIVGGAEDGAPVIATKIDSVTVQ